MKWLDRRDVEAIHAAQVMEFGGLQGLRDEGGLESALARALNLAASEHPDLCRLAAAYAFGICRNHPFVDGNKRTAFVSAAVFLEINGRILTASEEDVVVTFLALAAGELGEQELGRWFESNSKLERPPRPRVRGPRARKAPRTRR